MTLGDESAVVIPLPERDALTMLATVIVVFECEIRRVE